MAELALAQHLRLGRRREKCIDLALDEISLDRRPRP